MSHTRMGTPYEYMHDCYIASYVLIAIATYKINFICLNLYHSTITIIKLMMQLYFTELIQYGYTAHFLCV